MAVLVEAITVVARCDAIRQRFRGGMAGFKALVSNRAFCSDGELACVAFTNPADTEGFVRELEGRGLVFLEDGKAQDIAVVDQLRGPTTQVDWLECGHIMLDAQSPGQPERKVAACWLFEGPRLAHGVQLNASAQRLAVPAGWRFEESFSATPGFVPSAHATARKLVEAEWIALRWNALMDAAPQPLPAGIDLADRVEGMMLGLAIGDALGNTSESLSPAGRRQRFGWIESYLPHRHAGGRRVGLPSDDTQLAYRTLAHLVQHGRLDIESLGHALAAGRIFGIGQATRQWLQMYLAGVPWHASGAPSAGNGALMRIAPVLIPHLRSPSPDLWADALMAAHLTHDDELSNLSCIALVDALWHALGHTGGRPGGWLRRWARVCEALGTGQRYASRGHPPGFEGTMPELLAGHVQPALARALPVEQACAIWHSGSYLLETVPTVLYILERHAHDPREAILQAVNHAADSDTVAAIVGAVVGALHGASALPQEWVDGLSGRLAADDDHHLFYLLARAGQVFGYGSTSRVRSRAAAFAGRAAPA